MSKKIGIFYGSTTGQTAEAAQMIAKALGVPNEDVHDVGQTAPSAMGDYDVLILGTSTWGSGDLQDEWQDFIQGASELDLKGKQGAVFGCGDGSFSDTFCGGVGTLYTEMLPTGIQFLGRGYGVEGYDFEESPAEIDGQYVGLLLDRTNHDDLTEGRVKGWTDLLKLELE